MGEAATYRARSADQTHGWLTCGLTPSPHPAAKPFPPLCAGKTHLSLPCTLPGVHRVPLRIGQASCSGVEPMGQGLTLELALCYQRPHMIAVGDMTNQNSFKRIFMPLLYPPPPTQFLIYIF